MYKSFFASMLFLLGSLPASADGAKCTEMGTNGMVTMLLCPTDLDDEVLAEEGRIACGDRKPCGAWLWTDAAAIPETAPANHDDLPESAIQSAIAVWVNESGNLITIRRSEK
ncbi:MAG: hypothetical protein ACR2O1_05615 [Boseongicola sp.]